MEINNQPQVSNKSSSQNLQSPDAKRSKNLLVVISIVLVFSVGALGGYFIGFSKSQKKENQSTLPQPKISPTLSPSSPETRVQDKKRLLVEKEIEGGRIAAYRLKDDWSLNSDVFSIVLEVGEHHPVIFGVSNPGFDEKQLFEVIGDELLVVNGQTNKIDVYSYQFEKIENNTKYPSQFTYNESINLPRYQIGTIYSIRCEGRKCQINTAHHLESGCSMELDLDTKQYSTISCGDMSGEFSPEPL